MSVFYEEIRTVIDPEQADALPDGRVCQDVSVIMTQRRREPAIVTLSGAEALELAFELLAAAEQAERIGGRR